MLQRTLLLAAAVALAVWAAPAQAAEPEFEAAHFAAKYIQSLQNPDGGFPAFGSDSASGSTLDAVFALAATGRDPTVIANADNSSADYLESQAASYSTDPGAAAKLALGVSIMGLNPANFAGLDLLAIMDANYDDATGSYGLDLFDEAFFVLALLAAGQPVPAAGTQHLASQQQVDGGWEFSAGFGTDTNTTALVLQALLGAGTALGDQIVLDALAYLAGAQNADGGFGFVPGADSDPNSTAFVLQAVVAAGQDIEAGGPWAPGGNTPLDGLLAFRNPVTGAFQFFGEDSPFATYQAVPALMVTPFPQIPKAKQGLPGDSDGDGCSDERENGPIAQSGGRRSYLNPWDYFNPTKDGQNRVDDILAVVNQYFIDRPDPGYNPQTDRTFLGPDEWDLGPPNGQQRVDDILAQVDQYFHNCV